MTHWQSMYTKAEVKEIEQKMARQVKFPEALFQLAWQKGVAIPNLARIKISRDQQLPLLTVDIQNLTAVANDQPIKQVVEPKKSKAKLKPRRKKSAVNLKPSRGDQQVARKRLKSLLQRYDGLVQSGEAMGVMQFEKHRRYRSKALAILNDQDATLASLSRQANYLESQIQRLEERLHDRNFD
ncbi:MAG: hypothetical protein Q4B66_03730 [Ligilactobacillus agilis]|nr:hypothetical protein [Ligilactobacillus agilis]